MTHPLETLISKHLIDQVVQDCVAIVRDEVSQKRGMSGVVIKTGFKVVEKVRPSVLDDLFYSLLPSFIEELKPLYDDYQSHGQNNSIELGAYLISRATDVASSLLTVTDRRAQKSKMKTLVSAYKKLRPFAQEQIITAIPALARLLDRHLAHKD